MRNGGGGVIAAKAKVLELQRQAFRQVARADPRRVAGLLDRQRLFQQIKR